MLDVAMEHSTRPQSAPLYLCRRCVLAIMKRAVASDMIDPSEVFADAQTRDLSSPGPGGDPAGRKAGDSVVPGD
jgi:hypothetical protein